MQMNSILRESEKKFWLEFIDLYKNLPELWQTKNEVYKDRHRKAAAYKKLAKKLKEININADRLYVTRKINSMRGSYRRELNKLKKRQQYGDYSHVPNLWYFESMDFLRNQEGSNEEHQEENREDENSQMEDILEELAIQKEDEEIEEFDLLSPEEKPEIYLKERSKDKSRMRNRARQISVFKQDKNSSIDSDKTDIYGRCWAAEYSKLDPEQQIYAKRAIDEVLFQGRLGHLTIESTEIPVVLRN